jgi:hypothetical protein
MNSGDAVSSPLVAASGAARNRDVDDKNITRKGDSRAKSIAAFGRDEGDRTPPCTLLLFGKRLDKPL